MNSLRKRQLLWWSSCVGGKRRWLSGGMLNGSHLAAAANGTSSSTTLNHHQHDSDEPSSPPPSPPDRKGGSSEQRSVRGEVLNLAADLRTFSPGDRLEIPYELTITESMFDFWQSAFHSQDRIHTSRPFCRKMGLQDRVLPFSLALFLCSSMTHEDAARIHVGLGPVKYVWPCFAGDTFTKTYTVESIRNTSDGNLSLIQFQCDMFNQRGRLVMRADKRMLFEFTVPETSKSQRPKKIEPVEDPPNANLFRDHLLSKSNILEGLSSHSLAKLRPKQLILHSLKRSLSLTQSQQLASLARLTHEKHFDNRKYDPASEMLVPGGLVLGLTLSASARDFHELLHEDILSVNYVNELHPGNMVGAISYIQRVEEVVGDLQVVTVRSFGIKNMDVIKELEGLDLPLELLDSGTGVKGGGIKAKKIKEICKTKCPQLYNHIVVQVDRRILRQAPRQEVFLL